MGGIKAKFSGPPDAPDFTRAAEMQGASARPNQTNAFGATSRWTQGPDGQWTQTGGFAGPLGTGVSTLESQIGSQGPLDTGTQARDQAIQATYGQMASRLDPQWQQREEQVTNELANQGLSPGTEAYNNAMGNFNRARNDAYQTAQNEAIQQGLGAQQVTFGENLASQMAPYQQLGALSGLTGQAQAPQTQFLPAAMAAYQGALQGYGINQAGKNSFLSGLSRMGGNAATMGGGAPAGGGGMWA